ncbi:MAG: VOC family protein [Actinomycetota bacterium]|nr:VOC family protein [Actinomycetota bacterium]
MDFKRIMHVGIMAKNTGSLCNWYIKKLGFKKVYQLPATMERSEVYWLKFENNMIEIVPANNNMRRNRSIKDPGISHFSITVECFDEYLEKIIKKGIKVEDIHEFKEFKCGFFNDGEGNLVEILSFTKL